MLENPLGPVSVYIAAPLVVKFNVAPEQTGELELRTGVGVAITETLVLAVAVHPPILVAVILYKPVAAGVELVIVKFWVEALNPFGPTHEKAVADATEGFKLTDCPLQKEFALSVIVGIAFIETVLFVIAVQPLLPAVSV